MTWEVTDIDGTVYGLEEKMIDSLELGYNGDEVNEVHAYALEDAKHSDREKWGEDSDKAVSGCQSAS